MVKKEKKEEVAFEEVPSKRTTINGPFKIGKGASAEDQSKLKEAVLSHMNKDSVAGQLIAQGNKVN